MGLIIKAVKIEPKTKYKIYEKHRVTQEEIENTLLDKPKIRKVKNVYIAIGIWRRYLTIFFAYNKKHKEASILTGYPSSNWQIKMYKRRAKKNGL